MEGYSWRMPVGTPVFAAQDGEVVFAGKKESYYCTILSKMIDAELAVEVKHATLGDVGYRTTYRSLSSIVVKVGEQVKAGQRIGLSGQSACVAEPLLFFAVHKLSKTKTGKPTVVDPYGWDYTTPDPWEKNEEGSQSLYLWMDGEAPTLGGQ
jgi:murein DD-endopeptidase MepM/ murein hydrolase activator NlpD